MSRTMIQLKGDPNVTRFKIEDILHECGYTDKQIENLGNISIDGLLYKNKTTLVKNGTRIDVKNGDQTDQYYVKLVGGTPAEHTNHLQQAQHDAKLSQKMTDDMAKIRGKK